MYELYFVFIFAIVFNYALGWYVIYKIKEDEYKEGRSAILKSMKEIEFWTAILLGILGMIIFHIFYLFYERIYQICYKIKNCWNDRNNIRKKFIVWWNN